MIPEPVSPPSKQVGSKHIPAHILDRLRNSEISGERFATLFEFMATAAQALDQSVTTLSLEYLTPGEPLEPGNLIPSIQLTLTRVVDDTD